MVSQDSPPDPNSSILHQFIVSDSISTETQFSNQHFDTYGTDLRGSNSYPQSLDVLPSIESLGERMSRSVGIVQAPPMAEESGINHNSHLMDLLGASNETNHQPQRLSLSIGSRILVPSVEFRDRSLSSSLISPNYLVSGEESGGACNAGIQISFASPSAPFNQSCSTSYGSYSFALVIANSKYLRPTQSLLEETVSIGGKSLNSSNEKYIRRLSRNSRRGSLGLCSELNSELRNYGFSAEEHEIQVKIAKLIALLEEVERRYEEYYHHIEEVVSPFEVIAGLGASKSYTALALQAMSRHFCCLRDAIVSQINAAKLKFAHDLPKLNTGLSQISLFDQETRHNQMIRSQRLAWRPIRGLPEASVTVLRSWLFEHFLNPYPNDSEKLMLASQTGLTKNQISNWFINARVRLWKPMVEEMYKEEFADSSDYSNPREDVTHHAE